MYMKFRQLEDLESDLKSEKSQENEVIAYVQDMLMENGFEVDKKLNGVSFTHTYENDDAIYDCQFYMDTSSKTYSSYVTSNEDGVKQSTFQQKGPILEAKTAVDKLIKYLTTI